jgi:dolichol kinase
MSAKDVETAHEDKPKSENTPLLDPKVKEEQQGFVYRAATSGYLMEKPIPIPVWAPPAFVISCILVVVFVLPLVVGGSFTPFTPIMAAYFAAYISFDAGLRLVFGYSKYRILLNLGLSHDDIMLICGDQKVIPTAHLLDKSPWVYRLDSYSRKLLHIVHWAGLAWVVGLCTYSTYQRFQFTVMGATCSVLAQLCLWRSTNVVANIWFWLSTVRTGDGYARRMNNIYCTMSSVCCMGCVVPLCSSILSDAFHGDSPACAAAFLILVTFPCAWGDCLAEMVGVNGVLRFNVYGIGEINNKSVEGMIAMFLGSVLPALPWGWAVGGFWPGLCIIGVLATIAETWSPRGFDNIFIPVFSAIGVLISCSLLGIHPATLRAAPAGL